MLVQVNAISSQKAFAGARKWTRPSPSIRPSVTENRIGSLVAGECVSSAPSPSSAIIDRPSQTQFAYQLRSPMRTRKSVTTAENGCAIHTESVPGSRTSRCSSAKHRSAKQTSASDEPRTEAMVAAEGAAEVSRSV